MYKMKLAGLTDVGLVRTNNEDSFYIADDFFIVADGMGGAAAGEIASSIAVKTVSEGLERFKPSNEKEALEKLRKTIDDSNVAIKNYISINPLLDGMGTTIVAALRVGDKLLIGFVGDSRAYLLTRPNDAASKSGPQKTDPNAQTGVMRAFDDSQKSSSGEKIVRLTKDHSVVMEMVSSGVISEQDIRTHPLRNRITRCLGSMGRSDADFVWHEISDGDTVIICTDGLWEMVHEDLIHAIINSSKNIKDACARLITAAKNSGGHDNITLVIATFEK
jgi:PPM family protein phosphatase